MKRFLPLLLILVLILLSCTPLSNYSTTSESKLEPFIPNEKMGSGIFLPQPIDNFNNYSIPLSIFDVYEPIFRFGFNYNTENQDSLIVTQLISNYPAISAGIKIEDRITKVNNIPFNNIYEFEKAIIQIVQQDGLENLAMRFTIERENNIIQKEISPYVGLLRKDINYFRTEILRNRKIRVAIIISELSHPDLSNIEKIEHWKKMTGDLMIGNYESMLIQLLPDVEIVDRVTIHKVIEEQKLQLSGLVNSDQVAIVGELSGATHLVILSLARFTIQNGVMDTHTFRIIEVQSGEIMSSVFFNKPPNF
jgi:hypothetical protein